MRLFKQKFGLVGLRSRPYFFLACIAIFMLALQFIIFLANRTQVTICQPTALRSSHYNETMPIVYVVTPTYSRHVQQAELTRISHTLMLVPKIHWIIVEDSARGQTPLVTSLVERLNRKFGFNSITLLHEPTPHEYKLKPGEPSWKYPKGVWQRNAALAWLRQNISKQQLELGSVIYFADDDNTYDLELFEEMRDTVRVSVWPVGLAGGLLVERPLVTRDTEGIERVTGFNSRWEPTRPFPLDMAGFSINARLILSLAPNVSSFSANERIGYVESHFLGQFIRSWNELEPKASGCRKILVWHTKTKNPTLHEESHLKSPSNEGIEP